MWELIIYFNTCTAFLIFAQFNTQKVKIKIWRLKNLTSKSLWVIAYSVLQ